jgi:hypothetical protein
MAGDRRIRAGGTFDVARYKGSIYVSSGVGKGRGSTDCVRSEDGHPSLVRLRGSTQAFTLAVFKDPAGKTPEQCCSQERRCHEGGGGRPRPRDAGSIRCQTAFHKHAPNQENSTGATGFPA